MNIGNIATRKKVTARLLFARVGSPNVDLGNALLVKDELKVDRAQQLTMAGGIARITHEEPGKVDPRWSVKLDERTGPALQLLNLAKATFTYQNQAFNGGIHEQDDTFSIGWRNVINFAWDPSADPDHVPVEGDDYSLDLVNGEVTILSSFFSDNNLEFTCTFDVPGQAAKNGAITNIVDPLAGEYFVGAFDITLTAVHAVTANQNLVEGTDFTIDRASGMLNLLADWAADTIRVSFSQPAIPLTNYQLISEAFVRGLATLILTDQNNSAPREKDTFNAELSVSDWGENDGQKYNEFTLQLSATDGAIAVLQREI